ncbi:hypothetical protein BGW38_001687, partial [Lunasporangiospora selenospora]
MADPVTNEANADAVVASTTDQPSNDNERVDLLAFTETLSPDQVEAQVQHEGEPLIPQILSQDHSGDKAELDEMDPIQDAVTSKDNNPVD